MNEEKIIGIFKEKEDTFFVGITEDGNRGLFVEIKSNEKGFAYLNLTNEHTLHTFIKTLINLRDLNKVVCCCCGNETDVTDTQLRSVEGEKKHFCKRCLELSKDI